MYFSVDALSALVGYCQCVKMFNIEIAAVAQPDRLILQ